MKKKLRIAQVAPLWLPIPPEKYGGTEWIIYYLCEGLKKRGHQVTLFASGDSRVSVKLIPVAKKSLLKEKLPWKFLDYNVYSLSLVTKKAKYFDIIHTHIDLTEIFFPQFSLTPFVHTIHNPLYTSSNSAAGKHRLYLLNKFKNNNYITISNSQKKLCPYKLNFVANVYNGINLKEFKLNLKPKDYFLWAGRIDRYKGIENAIKIAKKAKVKLILAGRLDEAQKEYFEKNIKPHLNKNIIFIGEYSKSQKSKLFGAARAFLYPILWEEPFGLVMVEAMACGTPVIAFNRGSVPEVVKDKKTGFVVNNINEAVKAVKKIDQIKREDCRKWVEEKFTVERMVDEYEKVYYEVLKKSKKTI